MRSVIWVSPVPDPPLFRGWRWPLANANEFEPAWQGVWGFIASILSE
jgi:hypothetical protein